MHVLLFIFYGLLLGYAITRIPFFRKSGIKPVFLLLYFGLRVATGCLHNVVAYRYYPNHGDIWLYFTDSFTTRHELFTDLKLFWADNSTLAWLPHNLIECMHVVLNFLSFDNLYINTLFFSFFTLAGAIALFRVFADRYPNDWLSACCVLLLPSTLFWTSCIHTEGIVYSILGFFFFNLNKLLASDPPTGNQVTDPITGNPKPARRILICLFLFSGAVFFRPAIGIGLLPATLCWILLAKGIPRRKLFLLLLAGLAAVIVGALIIPGLFTPILQQLSTRQKEFQLLTGNSRIYLPILEPTWSSVVNVLPTALFNGFFQPLPGSGGQAIYGVFALELTLIWLIILGSLLSSLSGKAVPLSGKAVLPSAPISSGKSSLFIRSYFGLSCLLFSVLVMTLIGFIIPFVGSIIRYRSICLPFLLAPFLHHLRHYRGLVTLNNWLQKKIQKSPDQKDFL